MNLNQRWYILASVLLLAVLPNVASAYPSFISYGYASCITCHYNGQGNGPLNDYGRALFSTEIAARNVFSSRLSEEQIAAKSGFLGSKELPYWIRPGMKYRGLYFTSSPGSQAAISKYITMQADVNLAVQFDQAAKWLVVTSFGYSPTPSAKQGNKDADDKNWISREHYLRWQGTKKLYTYVGLMDKVYGIRTIDHTAFSRSVTGLAQNDQAHGVMMQYYGESEYEVSGHVFMGNMLQEAAEIRQKGFSFMYEKDIAEKNRVGAGFLQSSNDFVELTRLEVHSKLGLAKGNSLLSEIGFVKNNPKVAPSDRFGGYLMMEGVYAITRGYNLLSQIEYYNSTLSAETPDTTRWTFGLLMFPMPKMEFRTTFVNGRIIQDTTVTKDTWMLQAQLHLSL